MNKMLKSLCAVAALFGLAHASEYRTPSVAERGPIRYRFDKMRPDKWNFNTYTAYNSRWANKAFLKHGTDTHQLSTLFFGKSQFTLADALPNATVPFDVEEYSPYFTTFQFNPKVRYCEKGMNMGARFEYPVWCNNGRIGVRANVPFRCIEVARLDFDCDLDPQEEVVDSRVITVDRNHNGDAAGNGKVEVVATAYRADFVASLPATNDFSIVQGGNNSLTVLGSQIAKANDSKQNAPAVLVNTDADTNRPVLHAWSFVEDDNNAFTPGTSAATFGYAQHIGADHLVAVDPAKVAVAQDTAGFFDTATNYVGYQDKLAAQGSDLWFIFRRQTDSGTNDEGHFGDGQADTSGVGAAIANRIEALLRNYDESVYGFLCRKGLHLDSSARSGMGDIDVDFFYEHDFSCDARGEFFLGVRFPTGGKEKSAHNPYRPNLGNGGHFEIRLGALAAWQPVYWMNLKLDLQYAFALEDTEKRAAVFKGSKIKGVGPEVKADVDWSYFDGKLDLTFFHPRTCKLASTIGYQLYYKTQDHINFRVSKMESFLGHKSDSITLNAQDLDNRAARKGTERIAHKLRWETAYFISKYVELFIGGATTFAGQYISRDIDIHAGFNLRY